MKIIYEDNHLIVVEKPCNIPVCEDSSADKDLLTLTKEYLKEKYNKPGNVYLGLVHRLDRPVGGLVVFAKTSKAASRLSDQVRTHAFQKTYVAVTENPEIAAHDTFTDYLYKDEKKNMVSVVSKDKGKYAELSYDLLGKKDYALVKIHLLTGRSHQIRVQFSSRGHALYGDQRYNPKAKVGQQIALWAYELSFTHPTTRKQLTFRCDPPHTYPWNEFKEVL